MRNKLSVSLVKSPRKRRNIVRKYKRLRRNIVEQEKQVLVEQSERGLVRREQHQPRPTQQQEQAAPTAVGLHEEEEHPIV